MIHQNPHQTLLASFVLAIKLRCRPPSWGRRFIDLANKIASLSLLYPNILQLCYIFISILIHMTKGHDSLVTTPLAHGNTRSWSMCSLPAYISRLSCCSSTCFLPLASSKRRHVRNILLVLLITACLLMILQSLKTTARSRETTLDHIYWQSKTPSMALTAPAKNVVSMRTQIRSMRTDTKPQRGTRQKPKHHPYQISRGNRYQ